MKQYDIIGFGALNVDRLGHVDEISVDSEAIVTDETRSAGGSAANTTAALGRLGLSCGFIGAVGNDQEGELLLKAFADDHVDSSLVKKKKGNSGVVLGLSDSKGHRSLSIFPGVNNLIAKSDLPRSINTKWLHLGTFVHPDQLNQQVQWVLGLPKQISVSLSPGMIYASLGIKILKPLLSRCSIVFLTKKELRILTSGIGAKALGVDTIVVTDGSNGCEVITKQENFCLPAAETRVVDTTGAGDALAAGFLYGIINGYTTKGCLKAGISLAGFCIGAKGAREGLPKKKSYLIIGSGGREHAIGWKIRQQHPFSTIYFAPGNGGTEQIGKNISIMPKDTEALVQFAKVHEVDLTIVGPEVPLANGLVDRFTSVGLVAFGPSQKAARLENSKAWATRFMKRHGLPCPQSAIFTNILNAKKYVASLDGSCVIKADGLCQGKGVYVCSSIEEANCAIELLMVKKVFGTSGKTIVIQEKLVGKEISMMAFCDGTRTVPLIAAQDYKRISDGDRGGNTGGMGSVTPATRVNSALFASIHKLLSQTVLAMKKEGVPFKGILYAGIMVVGDKPYILEFNCRFGDPETQSQLPLLNSDLVQILTACAFGNLKSDMVVWSQKKAVCVVLASRGYPDKYVTGKIIHGVDEKSGVLVFHSGTIRNKGIVRTNGGRVLSVVSYSRENVYEYIRSTLSFDGMQYRGDIGK